MSQLTVISENIIKKKDLKYELEHAKNDILASINGDILKNVYFGSL